ncbi:hypothetical protein LWI28_002539 [Acer negundo]|uniref:Uncharacterized protein n=1 Tax=Acer negundo TaxID=4023 RepID=A0AAD5NMM9_ACENE|nr:hypothetical protein LWI28_002539 [Acer negundo]KAK4842001.1 hypothetical protein QYF36_014054 [Acer negundo]
MEPAKIDWKRIESVFVEDKLYENINAPKWVDFLRPEQHSVNDETWFCRPDCKHPKTAEDFLKTPPTSKLPRLIERLPFGDRSQRDARLKRRGQNQSSFSSNEKSKFNEDGENQNPNSPTPNNHQVKSLKEAMKSSSEKNKLINGTSQNDDQVLPRLKSTLSARNLFAGRDILGHITDFCNELKKLASRAREREENVEKKSEVGVKKEEVVATVSESCCEFLGELDLKEKESRKPLLDVEKEKSESIEKQRKNKRFEDDAENRPIPLKLENLKHKGEQRVLQIRTNPPSPQCFSATRPAPKTTTTTPLKASVSRPMERKMFQEMEQNKVVRKEELSSEKVKSVSNVVDGRGGALDVFWFLKPCTLST